MKHAVESLMELKKSNSFDTPLIQFWPAAALYMWARLESWETVIQLTSIDEGDLAMLIFRTADNLRQIMSLETTHPRLAELARTSISRLLREPVIIPV
jgi:superfamily II RNA helicase